VAYLLDTCALSEFTKPKPSASVDAWFAKIPEGADFVSVLAVVTRNTSDIARTGAPITDPW
jgi:predicted nucleic acid-binding protein